MITTIYSRETFDYIEACIEARTLPTDLVTAAELAEYSLVRVSLIDMAHGQALSVNEHDAKLANFLTAHYGHDFPQRLSDGVLHCWECDGYVRGGMTLAEASSEALYDVAIHNTHVAYTEYDCDCYLCQHYVSADLSEYMAADEFGVMRLGVIDNEASQIDAEPSERVSLVKSSGTASYCSGDAPNVPDDLSDNMLPELFGYFKWQTFVAANPAAFGYWATLIETQIADILSK